MNWRQNRSLFIFDTRTGSRSCPLNRANIEVSFLTTRTLGAVATNNDSSEINLIPKLCADGLAIVCSQRQGACISALGWLQQSYEIVLPQMFFSMQQLNAAALMTRKKIKDIEVVFNTGILYHFLNNCVFPFFPEIPL